ncbi:DoxX family protein [Spirosoma sp. BT702]|uniref:DoxX family protein n=1 Tax=Spirosoma profusum TaxID=2771354 RepID=A0A927ATC0_9BACT|nr:DoxX family protein [Spirosoma profusum]MBD2703125.1 DoxX family protein [Spirosoma profusum]
MDISLWLAQGFLAVVFGYSGWMKSTRLAPELVTIGQTGVEHLSTPLIRFIGFSELLGTLGLLLPWYTQILPILTPVSAICLGLIMLPAGIIHYQRNERRTVLLNVFIFLICLFVAYGRFAT